MAKTSSNPRHIGEILEAPGILELQALAESYGDCEVTILDSEISQKIVLRLVVTGFEWQPIDPGLGSTWPVVRVTYDNAASISDEQRRYSGHFVATQVHDINKNFDHGKIDER